MIRGRASDAVLRELLLDGGTGSSLIEENCQGCDESEGPRRASQIRSTPRLGWVIVGGGSGGAPTWQYCHSVDHA